MRTGGRFFLFAGRDHTVVPTVELAVEQPTRKETREKERRRKFGVDGAHTIGSTAEGKTCGAKPR